MEQFYTLLTDVGKAKIANATALQTKVKFTKLLVGDSNGSYYEPTEIQTKLKNKVWEGGIGNISIDKDNPSWVVLESVIPSNVGGFTIREIGIEDEEGDLVVIAKYPATYKPKIQDGSTKDLIIKTILEVANVDTITLKVDPTIVLTTKKDLIDSQKELESKIDKNFIKKQNKTTWSQLNTQDKNESGVTPHLSFNRPSVDDEIQLAPITDNFTNLDTVLHRMGATDLPTYYDIYTDSLQTPGRYLVYRLNDAPDVPPVDSRLYLINVICVNKQTKDFFYEIDSLGTGKKYTYRNKQFTEIPTRSALQPDDIYIDPKNGSDANDGSKDHPVLTWNCMVSRLPKILSKPLTINLLNDINDPVTLCNYRYCGDNASTTKLKINGNGHFINTLDLINNNLTGATYGIHISTLDAIRIRCYECSSTYVHVCDANRIDSEHTPIQCVSCKVGQYVADVNTVMIINGHKTPDELSTYGCVAYYGSLIFVRGSKPTGSGGDKLTSTGGRVEYEG